MAAPRAADRDRTHGSPPAGVNLVGYFDVPTSGLSEVARLLAVSLEQAGVPTSRIRYVEEALTRGENPLDGAKLFDINLICLNPPEFRGFAHCAGPALFAGKYSVGFWWWELAQFPPQLQANLGLVEEVWAGSDFIRDSIARETTKPVLTVPLPVDVPEPPVRSRSDLGLPEGFLFLFVFDFFSVFERKNPVAVVEAFKRAFRQEEGPALVVKSVNGHRRPKQLEQLERAAAARSDIRIVDGYVDQPEKDAMIASCDCYVSLHRSEGFGLTMAEAMAFAKPTIATRYSGNLTFMDDGNSYLVSYTPSAVPPGCDPYPIGAEWADPDIDEAATLMRRVFEQRSEAEAVGLQAQDDIARRHGVSQTASWLATRLDAIADLHAPTASARSATELMSVDRAIRRAFADLARGPRSLRRFGRALDAGREFALRGLGSRTTAVVLTAALRELLLVQQQQAKEVDELRRRVADLERR